MLLVIIVNIIIWLLFILKKEETMLWLPIIYIMISPFYVFLTDVSGINWEYSRASTILTYTEILYMIIISIYILIKYRKIANYWGILFFILYAIFLLIVFASDKETSLKNLLKFSRQFLLLPAAFVYFINNPSKNKFTKMIFILSSLSIIMVIIYSVLGIGYNAYGSSIIYYGGLTAFGGYLFVYLLPLILFISIEDKRKIFNILAAIILIIPVLSLKRIYILLIIYVFLIYLYYNVKSIKNISKIMLTIILLIIISIWTYELIMGMIEVRIDRFSDGFIMQEGRYLEYVVIYEDFVEGDNLKFKLFGNELFNNGGQIGKNFLIRADFTDRYFHSDYGEIIYSTGLIGIILYFIIFVRISKDYLKMKSFISMNIKYLFVTLIVMLLINGAIDGLFVFSARGLPLYFLGYCISQMYLEYYEKRFNTKIKV